MGLEWIWCSVHAWKNRTRRLIEDSSILWWSKWAKHAAELQLLRVDVENRQKEGDEFYKLEKEDFVAVKDELAEDFIVLADEQRAVVSQLIAQLDDDRLDNQIRFESYEKERLRQEATKSEATINLSDEEPSSKQRTDRDKDGKSQPELNQAEPPREEHSPQPPAPRAGQSQSEEQRPEEPETAQQLHQHQQPTEQQRSNSNSSNSLISFPRNP